jgi:DNA-binding response OmpR family regulator
VAGELAGARVLFLAGGAVTRELVKVYLAEGGADVVEASGGRGLAVALSADLPDVALVDLGDQATPPEEAMAALARQRVPVLGLAGRGDAARAAALRQAGAAGILDKPLAPEELLGALAALIHHRPG